MSHSKGSEHEPSNREKMLANMVAGIIISGFQLLLSIFSTIFRILASLA